MLLCIVLCALVIVEWSELKEPFHVISVHSYSVEMCEIVAVRKTEDDDQDAAQTGKHQKKTKQLYPYAFTGMTFTEALHYH